MLKTWASLSEKKSQCGQGGWAHNPTLTCGLTDNGQLLGKEMSLFSKSVASAKLITLQQKTTQNIWAAQIGLEDLK